MLQTKPYTFWFITGSQHLYGEDAIEQVRQHSQTMVEKLNEIGELPYTIELKEVLTTPDAIRKMVIAANSDDDCAGMITWMHTFSPAKMWINGLKQLKKPLLHLHTQFNREIPYDDIDMDFMNLNQSAHGDREYGHIGARLNISRKVIVGHWLNNDVQERLRAWMRTAVAFVDGHHLKVARFGDNMREVAVTEGDKVEAQIQFGWSITAFGIGDLVEKMKAVSEDEVRRLFDEYQELYRLSPSILEQDEVKAAVLEQAKMELALKEFLEEGGYTAFTTNFEDLHGMKQLPGLAVQRLMAEGYGFGGEGDWKTAALLRMMKIIADGKGTSFMEDYTYHLAEGNELVLGSHMLEICPTIAANQPEIQVHPLGIGGKEDPARLVFDGADGPALNASLIDLGHRFRLVVNEVEAIKPERDMPKLPVAKVLWKCKPSLSEATEAWIHAGGAHHTVFSFEVTPEQLYDWATLADIEVVFINDKTDVLQFQQQLQWNEAFRRLFK
ncbi:L-arabinose isomerase [Halalkalibacterium halodurans]|uniref:L-arabinose isomerase n=1 Tax=Halalkalibacterium halodurans TaxID=86665 RepID=UPI002E1E28FF|nr:L-arabinose isomerase [Halalkalibacterium halodurans]MED4082260.1 L-arabinose isomerase [Halalkalibacterium halodurans]MED4083589.1 L-arabinose isomerase [Halalkalibacterium halodurans]MED4105902.1 L-arabinose isomerase [Halalkalibacterium halodurans]MED4110014.1 L-arabinose isomerase [Halalkalibacterium halodurans]MED4125035.1 L-arabinose isomerase [Halalkalibacterium halodurans]